ncbi:MAG: cache domain-containing protein [Bacteroidetes bacterium]|nr:cache domain-containing protein [Bacteroidota bacterium]
MLNINKFFRFISIRTKLLVAIIGIAITPLMFLGYYGSVLVTESLENNFLKQRKTFIISKAREIENYLNDIQNDVLYLSKSYGIQEFIKNDKNNEKKYEKFRNILINDLLFFSQNKRAYYQIRYIDNLGNELIRLNYNNENVYAVPKKELQNKIKRYYFKETIRLPRGEIYISPIDLNIEHGEIETPPKYVFRYATTVFFEKNFISLIYKKPIKTLRQS